MGSKRSFRKAGRHLRCRACLVRHAVHSHHVVYEQELDDRGLPTHDSRNCMALCLDCHFQHHNGPVERKINIASISDENLAYAFEVLGSYAYDYLRRHYGHHDLGTRLADLLRAWEEARVAEWEARVEARVVA
jgi:hypothetical protein